MLNIILSLTYRQKVRLIQDRQTYFSSNIYLIAENETDQIHIQTIKQYLSHSRKRD